MHQHTQPIDNGMTARARGLQQFRFERIINDVADCRIGRQIVERQRQGRFAPQTRAGGIEQQSRSGSRDRPRAPGEGTQDCRCRSRQIADQTFGPCDIAREDTDLGGSHGVESKQCCPRGPAGTENGDSSTAQGFMSKIFAKAGNETSDVAVATFDMTATENQQIDRTRHQCCPIMPLGQRESRLLVGHRDIDARKICRSQAGDDRCERLSRYRQRDIGTVDGVFAKPIGMEPRRQ